MGWLQKRRARKTLSNLGMSEDYINEVTTELELGYKAAKNVRDELKKKESPTYRKLIKNINSIVDGDGPLELKRQTSFDLVIENGDLSEYESTDLLQQLNSIYGQSRTAEEEYHHVINTLKKLKQSTGTADARLRESVETIERSFIPYPDKADLIIKVTNFYTK